MSTQVLHTNTVTLHALFHSLPWRTMLPIGYVVSTFLVSCSSMGGAGPPTITAEGKLNPPIYKAADFRARPYCTRCRVEFESEAPQQMPAGALSLEIVGQDSDGVLHIAVRMHGVPDKLLSVKGTLELVGDSELEGSALPVKYRDYRPGDVFPTYGKPPCYDVNGTLTSLIRFVGTTCGSGEVACVVSPERKEGVLFVLSFDLLGAGDVRVRTTELLAAVCEGGCKKRDLVLLRRVIMYGGILHVRTET